MPKGQTGPRYNRGTYTKLNQKKEMCRVSRVLYDNTTALPKVAHVSLVFSVDRFPVASDHTFDRNGLLAFSMPPPQLLSQSLRGTINTDGPFTAANFDLRGISREVMLGQEDLRGCVLLSRAMSNKCKGEDAVLEIEPIRLDVPGGGGRTRPDVRFSGSVSQCT